MAKRRGRKFQLLTRNAQLLRILTWISEDFYFLSHRKDLLVGLQAHGLEISLVTNMAEKAEEVRATQLKVFELNLDRKNLSPLSVLKGARKFRHVVHGEKPDIIFAVALKPIIAASVSQFLGGKVPILCAFAGLGAAFSGNSKNLQMRAARWGMEKVFRTLLNHDRFYCLFQNYDDAQLFWDRRWTVKERSFVIHGAGVDLKKYVPKIWNADQPVSFLFAGRLLWDKGVRELVEACELLKKRGLEFKCRVAGLIDQTNRAAVPLSYIEEQDSEGLIEWLGHSSNVAGLMRQADCFVFPSVYREGVPRVLLEASAAGLPIITTDMPGCRDVVKTYHNGLIVPPRDSTKLAEAMEKCIRDRGQLPIWGENARRQALDEYGIEGVIKRHLEIFQTIARRHKIGAV